MNRLVYDSDQGRFCPECSRPIAGCECKSDPEPTGDGIVRVRREVRNGKPVSVVTGLLLAKGDLRKVAKQLKQKCGTGGTAKDQAIEIQGDHRNVIVEWLRTKGHEVKLAGG